MKKAYFMLLFLVALLFLSSCKAEDDYVPDISTPGSETAEEIPLSVIKELETLKITVADIIETYTPYEKTENVFKYIVENNFNLTITQHEGASVAEAVLTDITLLNSVTLFTGSGEQSAEALMSFRSGEDFSFSIDIPCADKSGFARVTVPFTYLPSVNGVPSQMKYESLGVSIALSGDEPILPAPVSVAESVPGGEVTVTNGYMISSAVYPHPSKNLIFYNYCAYTTEKTVIDKEIDGRYPGESIQYSYYDYNLVLADLNGGESIKFGAKAAALLTGKEESECAAAHFGFCCWSPDGAYALLTLFFSITDRYKVYYNIEEGTLTLGEHFYIFKHYYDAEKDNVLCVFYPDEASYSSSPASGNDFYPSGVYSFMANITTDWDYEYSAMKAAEGEKVYVRNIS